MKNKKLLTITNIHFKRNTENRNVYCKRLSIQMKNSKKMAVSKTVTADDFDSNYMLFANNDCVFEEFVRTSNFEQNENS